MRLDKKTEVIVSPLTPVVLTLFVALSSPVLLGALLAAALIHEWGHWVVLRHFGGHISRVTITPFGAEMTVADTTRLSYGAEILVTLAGPAVNLLLALCLGLAGGRWEGAYVFAGAQLVLGVFNLIPARPLDGARALWLLTAWLTEPFTADRVTAAVGGVFAAALLVGGLALMGRTGGSPFLLLGAVGLMMSAFREKGLVKFTPAR